MRVIGLGVPARVVGPLSEGQRAQALFAAAHYVERKEQYRRGEY